ncbi:MULTISPECIES: DNA translocase FtsK [unclassified Enterococcus]|uniref:DNA translocase FtsK n=1 Tax=unclassified Enterococcus TaxID=2608891 RepID=UPI0015527A10|nr:MULTISPECIES: DNA translocase FtsK [unclassified Enterococcus]MBS7578267.1 cell division protein FtsK [Enterococcus sp. MMGLQ5-2]MBS7585447.1 cell division protein FtsK [Enterococcus sp. MMGLQ5-1]NPD13304.1 cell division protein FtsK [Enterococcus sp. MMGLQ5-1]NPD38098.1 cell division protein FtsK [Enterococcus sp. MMGLQ5-2]
MAKRTRTKSTRRKTKKELAREARIRSIIIIIISILILMAGIFKVGFVGVVVYNLLRLIVGESAIILAILSIILLSLVLFRQTDLLKNNRHIWIGTLIVYLSSILMYQSILYLGLAKQEQSIIGYTFKLWLNDFTALKTMANLGGGLIGALIYSATHFLFDTVGSIVIAVIGMIAGLFMMLPISISNVMEWVEKWRNRPRKAPKVKKPRIVAESQAAEQQIADESETTLLEAQKLSSYQPFSDEPVKLVDTVENLEMNDEDLATDTSEQTEEFEHFSGVTLEDEANYELPPISLLKKMPAQSQNGERHRARNREQVLLDTFQAFNIEGIQIVDTKIGPSLTQYELKLPLGMRVNKFENLAKDLSLALGTSDIRIEAPIPGKSLVGIEIPNQTSMTVSFREVAEAALSSSHLLEVPLGRDIEGNVRSFDLTRMPHLLVAGSTGSGKSVAINGIITSILMKAKPSQVKFMMVDPKMVELSVYNDIPHLLTPVVTNPKKAARALQKVVEEMERRYELFSLLGVRNLAGYQEKMIESQKSDEILENLPLIVVIVDELADLMMVASKEVEDAIIRLGQKARAAGIHMILATQRPSTDVISGLIKANVPSRMAFAVSSGIDSRTILDMNGAEKLLGRGDMLFKPIDKNHPIRIQGAFLSDGEVENIVTFIKNQSEAEYVEHFEPEEIETSDNKEAAGQDELFDEARAMVIEAQKASASMLQRRLGTGFNRATRLMDELEQAGVIGPAVGTKPREVLIAKTEESE